MDEQYDALVEKIKQLEDENKRLRFDKIRHDGEEDKLAEQHNILFNGILAMRSLSEGKMSYNSIVPAYIRAMVGEHEPSYIIDRFVSYLTSELVKIKDENDERMYKKLSEFIKDQQ